MGRTRKPVVDSYSVKVSRSDSVSATAVRTYNWPLIFAAIRAIIQCVRENPHVRDLDPANNYDDLLVASARRHAIAGPAMTADFCFTIDYRHEDHVHVNADRVTWMLRCHYIDQKRLQLAAMNLWTVYRKAKPKLLDSAVPWLEDAELAKLEDAVNRMEAITVDSAPVTTKQKSHAGRKLEQKTANDNRVIEAWDTGSYTRYADVAKALGRSVQDVPKIIDRERKRRKRRERADGTASDN